MHSALYCMNLAIYASDRVTLPTLAAKGYLLGVAGADAIFCKGLERWEGVRVMSGCKHILRKGYHSSLMNGRGVHAWGFNPRGGS